MMIKTSSIFPAIPQCVNGALEESDHPGIWMDFIDAVFFLSKIAEGFCVDCFRSSDVQTAWFGSAVLRSSNNPGSRHSLANISKAGTLKRRHFAPKVPSVSEVAFRYPLKNATLPPNSAHASVRCNIQRRCSWNGVKLEYDACRG